MDLIVKTVDKTSVKFYDTFKYTINVSFNGIVGEINSAKVTDFFPSYISYILPSSIPYVKGITEEQSEGGTLVTFDFGSIIDLGISITINISCQFILGTDSLKTFENISNLYINNSLYTSSTAPVVTLSTVEDFIIEKDIAVPSNRLGSPGGRVIFSIILKNKLKSQGGNGDPGAKLSNIEITDAIPSDLLIDSNYPVLGKDISPSLYKDTRYDNQQATVTDNNISFSMSNYYGTAYRLVCVCNVDPNISTDQLLNTANLYVNETLRGSSTSTLSIGDPVYTGNIVKYGPNYGSVGDHVSFDIGTGNYGNMDLLNVIIEDKIPDEITAYRINTGSFQLDVIYIPIPQSYTIEYSINNTEPYILLGTYHTNTAQYVTLPTLGEGDKITKIRWNIPNYAVGMISSQRITIDGVVTSAGADNTFTNISELTYQDNTGINVVQATHFTDLNNKSELNLAKSKITNKSTFIPGDTVRYSLKFTGSGSQINNPVVSDLLPEKLQYIGNEKYTFYDYFNNTTIDSTNPNFQTLVPVVKTVEENYNNSNQTLVTYNLDTFSLRQKGQFTIELDTKIKVGASGSIVNYGIIGNKGDNAALLASGIPYSDVNDRDKDNITNETILRSSNNTTNIEYHNALSSDKKVKGALNEFYTEEPSVGLTYEGGSVDYKLTINNMGNLDYNYIQIVDILPHIGDTGVISTNSYRLSDFPIYITGNITAVVVENDTILSNVTPLVEYSQSYDPERFSGTNFGDDTIGSVNDWTTIPPTDITSIKSVRITLDNYLLQPNQSIVIDLYGIAPFGVTENLVAWNSIAVKGRYVDENGNTQKILPVEPEKVGVRVQSTNNGKISGHTWVDLNKNGNIDSNEPYLNNVLIKLFSSTMTLLNTTLTTNDINDSSGYFIFNNLDPGDYLIQFMKPSGMYYTLQTSDTQNQADSDTGFTDKLSITPTNLNIEDIDGGFIEELDLIILLIDLINDDILSIDCSSKALISSQIQNIINELINIINLTISYFNAKLISPDITDQGYKAQIQRLIGVLNNLLNILNNLSITNTSCDNNLLSYTLFLCTNISLELIKILEENYALDKYNNCPCLNMNLFKVMIGSFINSITNLDSLTSDAYSIIPALNSYGNIPQNYISSYVPNSRIISQSTLTNKLQCCPRKRNNMNQN